MKNVIHMLTNSNVVKTGKLGFELEPRKVGRGEK